MADTRPLLRWLAAHDTPDRVVLLCDDAPLPPVSRGSVVVRLDGCVQDATVDLPAQLLASGVRLVAVAPCPTFAEEAAARVEGWRQILPDGVASLTAPSRWRRGRAEVLALGSVPIPRRVVLGLRVDSPLDLDVDDAARTLIAFRLLREQGRAVLPPAVADAGAAPAAVPEELGAAADAPPVAAPGDTGGAQDAALAPTGAAADLGVSGCTACGVCVRACPHDALALEHDGGTSTLTHLAESCRSELECVALCPVDAFTLRGPLPLAAVLDEPVRTLATVTTAVCARCGARHPAEKGDLCPPCRFRAGNAFGSSLPPHLQAKLTSRQQPPAQADIRGPE